MPSDATVNDLLKEYHAAIISRHASPKQFAAYEQRMIGSRVTEYT